MVHYITLQCSSEQCSAEQYGEDEAGKWRGARGRSRNWTGSGGDCQEAGTGLEAAGSTGGRGLWEGGALEASQSCPRNEPFFDVTVGVSTDIPRCPG